MHKNAFCGRALPGPAGGAIALPRPLAVIRGREGIREKKRLTGRGGMEGSKDVKGWGGIERGGRERKEDRG